MPADRTFMTVGLRPFGVALLYVGWDPIYGFQLYQSDPSGNYSGWKATCIGANNASAASLLKQDYKDDLSWRCDEPLPQDHEQDNGHNQAQLGEA